MKYEAKEVAIVVLNWNGKHLIEQYAPEWIAHTPPNAELIIVDNGSQDDSLAYIQHNFPDIRLIAFGQNYGFAEGYNRALTLLDHPFVVLLNSDAIPTANWLTTPISLLKAQADIVAVQPKIKSLRNPEYFEYAGASGGYVDCLGYPYCRGRIMDTVERDTGQYDATTDIMWASGAALIIRRAEYLAVGGLDAAFFAHQEEIDLSWRLRARGWRIVSAPESVVYHLGGATLSVESPGKTYLNFRNNILMLYKNLPKLRLLVTLLLRLVLDMLAALRFAFALRGGNAWAVVRAWCSAIALMPQCRAQRAENLRQATIPPSRILTPLSIIYRYYLRRQRRWSEL